VDKLAVAWLPYGLRLDPLLRQDDIRVTAKARLRRIMSATSLRSWLVAAFLLAVVAAETFTVVHSLDLAAHANADPCKICVSAAGIDHAVAGDIPTLVHVPVAVDVVLATGTPLRSRAPVRQTARGPPQLS
jgi:hypothetical protein